MQIPVTQARHSEVFGEVRRHWGWMLALGVLMLLLGIIGLGLTYYLTFASVVLFGMLIFVGGAFQLVHAVKSRGWKSIGFQVLMAVAYLIAGIVMIGDPLGSSIWLTFAIAAMLLVAGIMRMIMAYQMRSHKGWGWVLFSGVLSVLLGIMVFSQWPTSGLWVIGLFIAIEMMIQGWSLIMIALAARLVITD